MSHTQTDTKYYTVSELYLVNPINIRLCLRKAAFLPIQRLTRRNESVNGKNESRKITTG